MPILEILGLDVGSITDDSLTELRNIFLPHAVAAIAELAIESHQVSVYIMAERPRRYSVTDVIVYVDALDIKPERTVEVKKRLVSTIADTVKELLLRAADRNWRLVEVRLRSETTDDTVYAMITPEQ